MSESKSDPLPIPLSFILSAALVAAALLVPDEVIQRFITSPLVQCMSPSGSDAERVAKLSEVGVISVRMLALFVGVGYLVLKPLTRRLHRNGSIDA